jgi:hypothetical protein
MVETVWMTEVILSGDISRLLNLTDIRSYFYFLSISIAVIWIKPDDLFEILSEKSQIPGFLLSITRNQALMFQHLF